MKELYTRKIFFKQFNHRVVINCKTGYKTDTPGMPTGEVINWLLEKKFPSGWRGVSTTGYSPTYANRYSVFFKDQEIMEYLKLCIDPQYFLEFEKPLDDAHTAMLESNDKLVTRKQLFYNKFRVVLRVDLTVKDSYWKSNENLNEMKAWCEDQFGEQRANKDRYSMQGYATGNFYFQDTKDAMLFKMVWGTDKVRTERVVTIAELQAANAKSQAAVEAA